MNIRLPEEPDFLVFPPSGEGNLAQSNSGTPCKLPLLLRSIKREDRNARAEDKKAK